MPDCADRCELAKNAHTVCVASRGSETPQIMQIGEAPGRTEDNVGRAFIGDSGKLLDDLNARTGVQDIVRITNVVRCCPYTDSQKSKIGKPTPKQVKHCAAINLFNEIIMYKPKILIALGDSAWKLFGKGNITKQQGQVVFYTIPADAYPQLGGEDLQLPVIPTFHPSYALRGNTFAEKAILQDIASARQFVEQPDPPPVFYTLADDLEQIEQFCSFLAQDHNINKNPYGIACDLETEGLDPWNPDMKIVGVGFSWEPTKGVFIPYNAPNSPFRNDPVALLRIRNALKNVFDNVKIIGQNFEFDRRWLWAHMGIRATLSFDTMSAHKWLFQDTKPHNLEYLTGAYTNLFGHKLAAKSAGAYEPGMMGTVDLDIVSDLCCGDCDATLRVMQVLRREIESNHPTAFYEYNIEPMNTLFGMEIAGAYLDVEFIDKYERELQRDMRKIMEEVKTIKLNGVELNELFKDSYKRDAKGNRQSILFSSPPRTKFLLYNVLRLPKLNKKKDSSDKQTLVNLQRALDKYPKADEWTGEPPLAFMDWVLVCREVLSGILKHRMLKKQQDTYTKPFKRKVLSDGCIHPQFHIASTRTGRPSASDPNVLNLPRKGDFKRAFVTRFKDGLIYQFDESQIEVRVMAYYSQDQKMIDMYHNEEDMHRMVAGKFLGKDPSEVTSEERSNIKSVVFGMFYDRGDEALAEATGLPLDTVVGIKNAFWEIFHRAKAWRDEIVSYARVNGLVYSANGRWRRFPHINNVDNKALKAEAERQAINHPIQALANDFTEHGITRMMRRVEAEGYLSLPFLEVYDSHEYDVYPGELFELVKMASYEFQDHAHELFPWFNVPFVIEHEIGFNLKDMIEVKIENERLVSKWLVKDGDKKLIQEIADTMSRWPNTAEVNLEHNGDKSRLVSSFYPAEKPGRGEAWFSWCDDNYKSPAFRPFYIDGLGL